MRRRHRRPAARMNEWEPADRHGGAAREELTLKKDQAATAATKDGAHG
jgi:hypothetical protein